MQRDARAGGAAAIIVGLGLATYFALEQLRVNLGFVDADDPSVMISFLREHSDLYVVTGIVFLLIGLSLLVLALAVWNVAHAARRGLALQAATAVGVLAAAYFFGQGVLRVQAPGTLLHIDGLNHDWGLAAFTAVQLAGTQGLASAGSFGLSIWAVAVVVITRGSGLLPRFVSWLAIIPAVHLLVGMVGPFDVLPDAAYLLYIAALFGVIVWCLALGLALLLWKEPAGATR